MAVGQGPAVSAHMIETEVARKQAIMALLDLVRHRRRMVIMSAPIAQP